jgi:hypothetical protein
MPIDQAGRLRGTVLHGKGARNAERIEAVHITPGRQNGRRAQHVTAGRRPDEASIERVQNARQFVVLGDQAIDHRQLLDQCIVRKIGRLFAAHHRLEQSAVRPDAMRRIGYRLQHLDALLDRGRLADDMQAVRDQGIFELQHRLGQRRDGLLCGAAPGRAGLSEFKRAGLHLDHDREVDAFYLVLRRATAPAFDRSLQLEQPLVQPGMRHRRRQIADQGGGGAALGDGAFGRIVRGIEIDVGQVGDHAVRPAGGGHAGLLARHELERAMGAEMQHGMGAEILA